MTIRTACSKVAKLAALTAFCLMPLHGAGAQAQEKSQRVATHTDWSVFTPQDPAECYIASQPTASVAKRGGKTVNNVRRGVITLYISTRPSDSVVNEVSFSAGYPLRKESTVEVKIGSSRFDLYIEGEVAWPESPAEDQKLIAAMKKGSTAVVTGISQRGTTTIDTFSLLGFTDALADSTKRCNVSG